MAIETELKLRLPPGAVPSLLTHPLLAAAPPRRQRLQNTYYDTPELDLLSRPMALRHRRRGQEWLLTVKGATPAVGGLARRQEWEAPVAPGIFSFSHVDHGELRHWLESLAPRLEPAFTTDFTRLSWIVEPAPGNRIEVALDRGSIESKGRKEALAEVELELLSGPESSLFALARQLDGLLGEKKALHPLAASKAERGYALFTGRLGPPTKNHPAPVSAKQGVVGAFRQAALDCLQVLQANEAGIMGGADPEYLHQARVAVRRLRSLFQLFAPALPPSFVARWLPAWRQLSRNLGQVRDWDVLAEETLPPLLTAFAGLPELSRLQARVAACRSAGHRQLVRRLKAPAYSRLLLDFATELFLLEESGRVDLADYGPKRLRRRQRKACRLAIALKNANLPQAHQLRIACKRLRYTLDWMPPELGGKRQRQRRRTLARLQEHLGRLNDLARARQLLAPLLPAKPGIVPAWIEGRQDLLWQDLPARLEAFLAVHPRQQRNKAAKTKA